MRESPRTAAAQRFFYLTQKGFEPYFPSSQSHFQLEEARVVDPFSSLTVQWIILPVLIVLLRIVDVSIGTVRIILLSKGLKHLAPVFGFFEVLIWLVAIRFVLHNVSSPIHYIAYAGGFAIGTYIGMLIEGRLSLGNLMVRIITRQGGDELVGFLREHGYRVTDLPARGNND